MFLLGRNLFLSQYAGLVAAWLLAVMPAHFCYSQVAHGYSSSILLSILALLFAKRAVDEGKYRLWAAFGLSGILGAWTLPSNAFLVVSLGVWAVLVGDVNVRRKAVATTLAWHRTTRWLRWPPPSICTSVPRHPTLRSSNTSCPKTAIYNCGPTGRVGV